MGKIQFRLFIIYILAILFVMLYGAWNLDKALGAECQPKVLSEGHYYTGDRTEMCKQEVDVNCDGITDLVNEWIVVKGAWVLEQSYGTTGCSGMSCYRWVPITG